ERLQQEGIFRVNGNVKAVERLRLKYDKGEKLDLAEEGDICSVASLLKLFLRELPDAVIPSKLHLRFMQFQYDHNGNLEELKYLIKQLPDINYCLLKFLCHFLTQVAIHHEANRMTVYNLGTVFGPNVFRVSPGFEGMKEQNISNKLMASMLENYDFFFENVKDADSPPANQTKLIVVQVSAFTSDPISEPVPAFSSWQRPEAESEEARLSPQAGRLIRHLLEEDTHPMVSPRFYAYGQSQQFQNDTEVPPSPPNSHSFMRRRSSSLGSYDDDREDLTPAQMSKRIQNLKKKIRKFEEKFEEERRYRPSHSDKATNPEVLKWMNELAKLRKQLKDVKLNVSEEDLAPQVRQRSNTLPKSFGSQLEKGPEQEKKPDVAERAQKPTVDTTLESILKKLQEKRVEMQRSEDIKDMTRDQISEEKVALQKGLLYYESIHGRPVTKSERLVMKPLYDRYRLVKQILSRATTIPVIVSTQGFVSPVDEKAAGKCTLDLRLSNLHSASMPELLEQLQEARTDKKRLRKTLRDFEDTFFQENGRNVQKEDRAPMTEEYNEYKHVKAKLRLLEVLISKQDSSKVV
uniref:Family with sequence similarity 13 member A n=1 Tax=Callorhinchus milii TaxID=7868 RepID=A0A4W3ICW8_CALMI